MKKTAFFFALLIVLVFSGSAFSAPKEKDTLPIPVVYLGSGFGFNDLGVLGASCELPLTRSVSASLNLGIGSWGGKVGAEASFYFPSVLKGAFISVGYQYATGKDSVPLTLAVEPNGAERDLVVDLLPQQTINAKYSYALGIGAKKKNKLVLSIGYAAPLKKLPYSVQNNGAVLTEEAESSLKLMEPGGFIFGAKFMFGLGTRR